MSITPSIKQRIFMYIFFFEFSPGDYSHLNIFKRAQKGRFTEVYKSFEEENNNNNNRRTERPSARARSGRATDKQGNIGGRGDYYIGTNELFDDASRRVNDAVT